MSSMRRRGREAAVQWLYASEAEGQLPTGQDCANFWQLCVAKPAGRQFAEKIVNGVLQHLEHIDSQLADSIQNYELGRLAAVDRNILRVGTYELLFAEDIPTKVVINEAVEIAKTFGSTESGRFVHGVLDEIRRRNESTGPVKTP
jgi:transcription antitermination protein NusB